MALNAADPLPPQSAPHPAVSLIVSFEVILSGATVVQVVSSVLV